MDPKRFAWPHGARTAVLVSVLLESWSDGKGPSYFPRTTPAQAGSTDHAAVQWGRFGGQEGVWRLLAILERHALPASFVCSGRSAELYPAAIAAIAGAGQEIVAHGYVQDQSLAALPPEAQQAVIRRSLDALEAAAGRRPQGWVSAAYGWEPGTADLLVQEGLLWHADALDASLPRLVETASGRLVAFPWSEFVDNRLLRGNPQDFSAAYRDGFDYLYEHEPMSLLHIGIHSHFGGRPLMAAQLDRLLRHLKQFPEVWFARPTEIARPMLAGTLEVPSLRLKSGL